MENSQIENSQIANSKMEKGNSRIKIIKNFQMKQWKIPPKCDTFPNEKNSQMRKFPNDKMQNS